MSNSNAMVTVPFHGDHLDAVQDQDGKVWVSLRRCSENLGVDPDSQKRKLLSKPWACTVEMTVHDSSGREQPLTMIDMETLPGWLFSIDARKVREQVREKLARYQREAAKVLADYFYGRAARVDAEHVRSVVAAEIERLLPRYPQPMPAVPRVTVQERCRFKGWHTTSGRQRAEVRKLANWLLELRHGETPDQLGGTCVYYGHQIACLDEAIDRTREEYARVEDYALFAGRD